MISNVTCEYDSASEQAADDLRNILQLLQPLLKLEG
jgi:hypothetical protein